MQAHTALLDEHLRPLKRAEDDRLVELGAFDGEHVELLYGRIVEMVTQGDDHASAVVQLNRALTPALGERADVRIQLPFACGDDSEPEPDVAVVPAGSTWTGDHPHRAHLVIEVAATRHEEDRGPKAALYARADVRVELSRILPPER